ncbi:S41 family peptidase [Macrococcoides caseolyticum]|uniref:S41 family peptidase n=1 Tax=Macrococcoides caseolyticum TaxID=69966 RepID=UPI001F3731B0|nr:S41 family peptidase [Macrococcus caseolyticus]MCE4957016.1 S41 family peptidase [Macrococcus caseolyticus]
MNNEDHEQVNKKQNKHYVISPFKFIMMIVSTIVITAAVTAFSILSGNDKIITDEAPKRSEFVKLYHVYDTLNKDYYKSVDKEALVDGAIKGMVEGLKDPYSEYMTEKEQNDFTESMQGDFQGIGAEIEEKDGKILISSPIKDAPAYKAGIKPNDIIVAINGKTIEGWTTQQVVNKIRGKKGTIVELTINRSNQDPFKVKIKRDKIHMNSVFTKMMKDKTAIITVSKFQDKTSKEFHDALQEMHDKGMKRLVIDMRNNPGGFLNEATKMANEFLEQGDTVLYTENNKGEKKAMTASEPANPITKDLKTVIILNEGSASASEVFAEAMRENGYAEIIGTKSFGKGIVQTATPYKDKSMLKYTEMKWLTPKENWIHKKGIIPDVEVKLPEYTNAQIINSDSVLSLGEKGNQVKSLELGLKALGYQPGKIDNTFDTETEQALIQFQTDNGLDMNGQLSGKTTEKFTELLMKKVQKDDTQLTAALKAVKSK